MDTPAKDEKDFCTLLNEQIIDERNATKSYKLLMDLFEEERDLLMPKPLRQLSPREAHAILDMYKDRIKEIASDEQHHMETLEVILRKNLCEVKEK